jgi:hypothetical protein
MSLEEYVVEEMLRDAAGTGSPKERTNLPELIAASPLKGIDLEFESDADTGEGNGRIELQGRGNERRRPYREDLAPRFLLERFAIRGFGLVLGTALGRGIRYLRIGEAAWNSRGAILRRARLCRYRQHQVDQATRSECLYRLSLRALYPKCPAIHFRPSLSALLRSALPIKIWRDPG